MELLEFTEAASVYSQLARLEPENDTWPECQSKATALADATPYDVKHSVDSTPALPSVRVLAPQLNGCTLAQILSVGRLAEASEIKRAYHQQCLQWHPDKHTSSLEATRRANTMFKRITSAYETLSSETKRAQLCTHSVFVGCFCSHFSSRCGFIAGSEYDLSVHMKELRRRASRESAYKFSQHDSFSNSVYLPRAHVFRLPACPFQNSLNSKAISNSPVRLQYVKQSDAFDVHNENLSTSNFYSASEFESTKGLFSRNPSFSRYGRPPFYHAWSHDNLDG